MHHQIVLHTEYNLVPEGLRYSHFWECYGKNNFIPKTFWFNSGRDSAYINVEGWGKAKFQWYALCLRDLSSNGCKVSDTVRNLYIRLCFHRPSTMFQQTMERDMEDFMSDFMTNCCVPFRNLLLVFRSLENVCFTTKPSATPSDQSRNATFLKQVQGWLECKKDNFVDGKPPTMYLADGKTEKGGEDGMPRKPPQA
tara:strand:- start:168 stop:755 length:588 start_codon:yes stop_codon:yes gene_type:complete